MKTQKNSVRRSLIISATALVISIAMLIGTTFAWFTDSVTSGTNKIVAGNLDVQLEYKNTQDGDFSEVTPTTNVFKDDTLWEPGHVEYAVLKISNAGTLALKYKLAVNVVDEKQGTSVKTDAPFKLSDFLQYAVVDNDISGNTRADMVAAAKRTATKLSNGYALTDAHLLKGQDKTVTLVVWMPDDTGNEANYKKGSEIPTIQLGINLVATQYTEEYDSFDNTYDESADGTPDNGSLWNGTTIAQTTVPVQSEGNTTIEADGVTATVPAASVDNDVTDLTLTMIETTKPANVTLVNDAGETLTYDVSLKDQDNNVVKAAENTYFTFTIDLKPNLDIVSFKHHNDALQKVTSITANDQYVYDAVTGKLTFSTDDFSPFTAEWKFDGGNGTEDNPYLISTAEQLLSLENEGSYSYKLTNDITIPDEVYLSKKKVTVDLNGHSVTLDYAANVKPNNGSVFYIGGPKGELTIKDTSEAKTGTVNGYDKEYSNKVMSAVRAGNYSKLNIYGGNFVGRSNATSCIFVYTNASTSCKATVNIYGGTFKTLTPNGNTYYVLNHQDGFSASCTMTVYGGKFYNYNPGVTVVDPVNARTGKIVLAEGATTSESTEDNDTVYTITSSQAAQ